MHLHDAFNKLTRPGATRILQQAAQRDQIPYAHLVAEAGLDAATASKQLRRLHRDGLIDRTHPYGSVIVLAPPGRALGPVYESLAAWQTVTHSVTPEASVGLRRHALNPLMPATVPLGPAGTQATRPRR
ncbi:MarR family transcriptional regulator [Streptomyces sp. NPDC058471]|uniref:MarR family transcriptional regulator n=1 Tax=Streptomyces sp. NPDC058471 TaxID=3346516 RepID=UPI003658FF69